MYMLSICKWGMKKNPEEDNESTSIAKKMSQVRFLIGEYLDGDTHEYDNAFTLVSNWEF